MTDQEDCTFCQIIARHIPASVVYDDELVMVFLTIQPVNPGHLLVVPHQHAENLADLPDSTVAHMFVTAAHMPLTKTSCMPMSTSFPVSPGINSKSKPAGLSPPPPPNGTPFVTISSRQPINWVGYTAQIAPPDRVKLKITV
jgi:hypothetical protein